MVTGTIFDLMKYSLHDGPGIRTTVFLKGCPLRCWWCHNPESQRTSQEVLVWSERCIGCGDCIKVCPHAAIEIPHKCVICGKCTDVCPANARELIGREISVNQLLIEIEKDRIFYEQSGGGVTFSGGEPFMQAEFLKELLLACKKNALHTVIETCGYAKTQTFLEVASLADIIYFDLKIIDEEKHRKYTGVSNKLILENLKLLTNENKETVVRMPIIPGINDDEENLRMTADFLKNIGKISEVHLLPYHNFGVEKYARLGRNYHLHDVSRPNDEEMQNVAEYMRKLGLNVKTGG